MTNFDSSNLTEVSADSVAVGSLAIMVNGMVFALGSGSGGQGLRYVYFDIPDESQIEEGTRLLLTIDFANADDFSDAVSFTQADCQLFNPATGNWISIPEDGIDLAVASSKLRLPMPSTSYSNCRYRWMVDGGEIGSYKTAII